MKSCSSCSVNFKHKVNWRTSQRHENRNGCRRCRKTSIRVCFEGNDNEHRGDVQFPSAKTEFVAETLLPTCNGLFRLRGYRHTVDDWKTVTEPSAIICGEVEGESAVPVRVHDACFTSEVLGSLKCDCAQQLDLALNYIQDNPPGLVIYLLQEGRGIGLANKIAAYALQEKGLDTVDANRALGLPDDCREYSAVNNILQDLKIRSICLMTNNPRKIKHLKDLGIKIEKRIPCLVQPGAFNKGYLEAKERRMDHLLEGSWCYWNHEGDSATVSSSALLSDLNSEPGANSTSDENFSDSKNEL